MQLAVTVMHFRKVKQMRYSGNVGKSFFTMLTTWQRVTCVKVLVAQIIKIFSSIMKPWN